MQSFVFVEEKDARQGLFAFGDATVYYAGHVEVRGEVGWGGVGWGGVGWGGVG